jgi:transcriptional regulator with XRE-family HTH domain
MTQRSDYERFESSSPDNRRLLREEELIVGVAEAIWREMEKQDVSRAALAKLLGKTPGYVTQILSGERNLTLRTLADVADALDSGVRIKLCRNVQTASERSVISVSLQSSWQAGKVLEYSRGHDAQMRIPLTGGTGRLVEVNEDMAA